MGVRFQSRAAGENHHDAKLTEEDVRYIRFLYHVCRPEALEAYRGMTMAGLAEKFAVSEQTIHECVTYKTWKHVPDDFGGFGR